MCITEDIDAISVAAKITKECISEYRELPASSGTNTSGIPGFNKLMLHIIVTTGGLPSLLVMSEILKEKYSTLHCIYNYRRFVRNVLLADLVNSNKKKMEEATGYDVSCNLEDDFDLGFFCMRGRSLVFDVTFCLSQQQMETLKDADGTVILLEDWQEKIEQYKGFAIYKENVLDNLIAAINAHDKMSRLV